MIISSIKSADQLRLFDSPLDPTDHGYARNVVGDLCEEITAIVLDGRRHKTDSRADYCPDVSVRSVYCSRGRNVHTIQFYECKASGLSNQFFIYEGRLDKDREFARQRVLNYMIWSHGVRTKDARSVNELKRLLLQKMIAGYIVPFSVIDDLCSQAKVEKLNSRYGHRPGFAGKMYGSGYRLSLKQIEDFRAIEWNYLPSQCRPH